MSMIRFVVGLAVIAAIVVVGSGAVKVQENDMLTRRVELLEQRVQKLESILFATSQLSLIEAEQRLEAANHQLKQSRKLHIKGFITAAQLDADRFQVQQAERLLQLAKAENGQQRILNRIDISEAERELEYAKQNLTFTQRMFDRGYASEFQLQTAEQEVVNSEKKLELAQSKADAAAELFNSQKNPLPAPDVPDTDKKPDDKQ